MARIRAKKTASFKAEINESGELTCTSSFTASFFTAFTFLQRKKLISTVTTANTAKGKINGDINEGYTTETSARTRMNITPLARITAKAKARADFNAFLLRSAKLKVVAV